MASKILYSCFDCGHVNEISFLKDEFDDVDIECGSELPERVQFTKGEECKKCEMPIVIRQIQTTEVWPEMG